VLRDVAHLVLVWEEEEGSRKEQRSGTKEGRKRVTGGRKQLALSLPLHAFLEKEKKAGF